MSWERKAAEYRLQQMRAHQLREGVPQPVVRPRRSRSTMIHHRDPFIYSNFRLWWVANARQELYEVALGG